MDDHISIRLEQAMDRLASALERHGFAPELESAANQKRRDYLGEPIARSYDFEDAGPSHGTRSVDPGSAFGMILERLQIEARNMLEIGHKLREHADIVYGPVPQEVGVNRTRSEDRLPWDGGLGEIFMAIEQLVEANSYVAYQAGRNTTLA